MKPDVYRIILIQTTAAAIAPILSLCFGFLLVVLFMFSPAREDDTVTNLIYVISGGLIGGGAGAMNSSQRAFRASDMTDHPNRRESDRQS